MQILDRAVAILRAGKGRVDGSRVAAKLETLAVLGDQAAKIWQGYLSQPGPPGDKYTLISWMGAARARELYSLSLDAHGLVGEISAAAGDAARFLVLDESPIVLAYGQLKDGETGPQAAAARLAAQQAMNHHLRVLAGQVRNAKAVPAGRAAAKPKAKKAAAKPAGKRATAAKKPAAKKTAKKPVKKSARPAAKKAVKKSPKKK